MKSLFELISKHTKSNAIIPIIALAAIVLIIVLYITVKKKWVKYAISGGILLIGLIIFYNGYNKLLLKSGLDSIVLATKIIVFGGVGLMFSAVLDILDSLSKIFSKNREDNEKKQKLKDGLDEDYDDIFNDDDDLDDIDDDFDDDLDDFDDDFDDDLDDYDDDFDDDMDYGKTRKLKNNDIESFENIKVVKDIEMTQKSDATDFKQTHKIDISDIKQSDIKETQVIDIKENNTQKINTKLGQKADLDETQVINLKDIK